MNGGSTGDDHRVVDSGCSAPPVTCGTLGTVGAQRVRLLTWVDSELSPIHRPYHHHRTLISILTGESERQP